MEWNNKLQPKKRSLVAKTKEGFSYYFSDKPYYLDLLAAYDSLYDGNPVLTEQGNSLINQLAAKYNVNEEEIANKWETLYMNDYYEKYRQDKFDKMMEEMKPMVDAGVFDDEFKQLAKMKKKGPDTSKN